MAGSDTAAEERAPAGIPRLMHVLGVRSGEGAAAAWTAALFAASQANQGLGINTADTLFFLRFGVEFLPTMILLSGPVVMVGVLAHVAGLAKVGAGRWLPVVFVGSAAMLILERLGIQFDVPGIYPVVWLVGQLVMTLSLTCMWTAAGEVFTTRQAKRLFPLFASAGIAGGVVGNASTGPLAGAVGAENLLLVQAGLLVLSAALAGALATRFFAGPPASSPEPVLTDLRAGLELTLASPLLRMVAGVGVAFGALAFLVVFPFSQIVTVSFATETEVATFLGFFSAVATAATFLVSLFATNRLFARLGVVATLMVVPLVYVGGFSAWLVSFGLVSATVARGLQFVAVNAIGGTAWSSLFNVLGPRRRGQVMAFMTAGPMQLGTMVSGGLLLAGAGLPRPARTAVGLALAVGTLVLVARMRRAYGSALVDAVQRGLVDIFASPSTGVRKPSLDADTARAMSACLADPRPGARLMAVASLGRVEDEESGELLEEALRDGDARVRMAALGQLTGARWRAYAPSLLSDPAPEVRRGVLERMAEGDPPDLPDLTGVLHDPDPSVRGAAAVVAGGEVGAAVVEALLRSDAVDHLIAGLRALQRRPDLAVPGLDRTELAGLLDHPHSRVRAGAGAVMAAWPGHAGRVRALLDDPSVVTRQAAAEALARRDTGVAVLLQVLEDGSVRATDSALRALAGSGRGGGALAGWASAEISRAGYLRRHRLALDGPHEPTAAAAYLLWLLETREQRLERWAILALTTPETEQAMRTVMRGVWVDDAETRSQAMEALDSLGDRAVVGQLLQLLEGEATGPPADRRASLRELAGDHDDWIRALAHRCLRDDLMADVQRLADAAARDRSPLVRDALAGWEPPIMQELDTLDVMERVLVLQRVPLFSAIDPEELERVATVVTERRYQPGERIFHMGEEGDEILLIASGEVVVSRESGGVSVPIRSYGAGEHVGELAVLRGRPRSSDVFAGSDGVHCLVLTGAQLQAILEERPEVAMAMLGTLAERLATM